MSKRLHMEKKKHDQLSVHIYETREEMGLDAANDIIQKVEQLLFSQSTVRMIFAAAPSQNEVLKALANSTIDWSRVVAFHMDEYLGLPSNAPQRFGNFLCNNLFSHLPFKAVHLMRMRQEYLEEDISAYVTELEKAPIDIVCCGIGENGHIAFNDPPVADFNDSETLKKVLLEQSCRQQQVHDGCFTTLEDVPRYAVTLTIPALFKANSLFCIVPGALKYNAVNATLNGPISTSCPASILRTHPNCTLYTDKSAFYGE